MKAFALLKFRTVVARSLYTRVISTLMVCALAMALVVMTDYSMAHAQTTGCTTPECESQRTCQAGLEELTSAYAAADAFCGHVRCGEKLRLCSNAAAALNEFDVNSPTAEDCDDALAGARCEGLTSTSKTSSEGADYQRDQRLSEQERKDAKKELAGLKKEQADQQKQNSEEQANLAEDFDKLDKQYREDKKAVQQALKDTISSLEEQKTSAYFDAQQKYDEFDQKYIEMRDAARRIADDAANSQTKRLTECRSEADSRFQKAEAEQKQKISAENAVLKNQGLRGLAGYYNRQKKKRNQASKLNYSGYFRDCMDGITPTGAAALERIDNLQKKKLSDEKNLADHATRLEKLRAQTIERLNYVVKMAEEGKQKAIIEEKEKLAEVERDYQIAKKRLEQRQAMAYHNQNQQNQAMQAQIEAAGEELKKASSAVQASHSRNICAQRLSGVPDPNLIKAFKEKVSKADQLCRLGLPCNEQQASNLSTLCTQLRSTMADIGGGGASSTRGVASPATSAPSFAPRSVPTSVPSTGTAPAVR